VDVVDASLALQVPVNIESASDVYIEADVNSDGRIELQEVIYILQEVSGLR
jgi:hypothetical protein